MEETQRQLREYKESRSEVAFGELVSRYIDLVYSVALRRVSGDVHLARDIVQTVFTDFARKALFLPDDVMLGGWLHRHTHFVASTACRSEIRRKVREREAMDTFATGDSEVQEFPMELDEAIEDLEEVDRTAIVLRFFEQASFRTIGTALGISDDAAQKRVGRALEKLRSLLQARGLTLSLAGLSSVISLQSVRAAPSGWVSEVSANALEALPVGIRMAAGVFAFCAPPGAKIALAILLTAAGVATYSLRSHVPRSAANLPLQKPLPLALSSTNTSNGIRWDINPDQDILTPTETARSNVLRLKLVAADSGIPVPNAILDYRAWERDKFSKKRLQANRLGDCDVDLNLLTLTRLELVTRVDGFADTLLRWHLDRGDKVPANYTLRLARSAVISGRVLDSEGKPIQDAKVGFDHQQDPASGGSLESHDFGWIETLTDAQGHWQINRIAEEVLPRIYGSAEHEDYVRSPLVMIQNNREALEQMKAGTHIFRLGDGIVVRGTVVDAEKHRLANASVLIGRQGETGARRGITSADGSFEIKGCAPGKNLVSAEAKTFAPNTVPIAIAAKMKPVQIVLKPGKLLRLRVVDRSGDGIPNAHVWLTTFQNGPRERSAEVPTLIQTAFSATTDSEGGVIWPEAPERELMLNFRAVGYQRSAVKLWPDGVEHTVTLLPSLKITGTVRDALNGIRIPRFKIMVGAPLRDSRQNQPSAHWSGIERFTIAFRDGRFECSFEEPVVSGTKEMEFVFKIEADGYEPYISRVVNAEEETVRFDIRLTAVSPIRIAVILPTGEPATKTAVAFAAPSDQFTIGPNGFVSSIGDTMATTDRNGQISWQRDQNVAEIIAINNQGFAEMTPAALVDNPVIQLRSWGAVEGIISRHAKGVAGCKLSLEKLRTKADSVWLHWEIQPTTDASGNFKFLQAPPGDFSLALSLTNRGESLPLTQIQLQSLVIRSAETNLVQYDDNTVEVVAHLKWPDHAPRDPKQRVYVAIHTPMTSASPERNDDLNVLIRSQNQAEIADSTTTARVWVMLETPGNIWKNSMVPFGNYTLSAIVVSPTTNEKQSNVLFQGKAQVSIDPAFADETLDAGEILLEKPSSISLP